MIMRIPIAVSTIIYRHANIPQDGGFTRHENAATIAPMPKILPHQMLTWGEHDEESAFLLGDRVTWAKGTRARQQELQGVLRGKQSLKMGIARLVREPANVHDSNAVAILMGIDRLEKVGYLRREIAAELAESIDALSASSNAAPTVLAAIEKIGAFGDQAWAVKLLGPWPIKLSSEMSRDAERVGELSKENNEAMDLARSAASSVEDAAETTRNAIADAHRAYSHAAAATEQIDHLNRQLFGANQDIRQLRAKPSGYGGGTALLCVSLGMMFGGCSVGACMGKGSHDVTAAPVVPSVAPSSVDSTAPPVDAGRDARAAKK